MAGSVRFTKIPKINDLITTGVPTEAIPTYCALADYANNKSGLCFPKMETLARTLNRSVRTIQRHLHLLNERGLVRFVERRRHKGRFSSYLYEIIFLASTTGHGRRVGRGTPNKRGTKRTTNTPKSPKNDPAEGYWWFFGERAPPGAQEAHDREVAKRRQEEAGRRVEGYEWLFE